MFKKIFLPLLCLSFLTACAPALSSSGDSGEVQDIQPGDASIIQPPSQQSATPSKVGERDI